MRNIAIFTHDLYPFKPWGQGRYVYDLVEHVRPKYHRKTFVFSPSEAVNDELHIQIFPGSHRSIGKNITFSFKLACVIERLVEKYHLGLVHFQGGPGGLFLPKRLTIPVLYTVHHTYYQQQKYIGSQRWKILLYLLERLSYKNADYLICVSPSTRDVLLEKYNLSPNLCTVIPDGVDLQRFFPLNQTKIHNSLFFLGRFERRKGIDFLIKAIPRVRESFADVKLYIAGSGVLSPGLEKYIKKNHLSRNLSFLGTIKDTSLNEWYNKMEIVIVPSVFEGFGLTAIEAMACGTPVIATDVDALRDVVEDGFNGLLVPYNDVQALSDKIICMLKNRSEQSKFSINGREKVKTLYNWNKISQDILKVYEDVLENQRS